MFIKDLSNVMVVGQYIVVLTMLPNYNTKTLWQGFMSDVPVELLDKQVRHICMDVALDEIPIMCIEIQEV